MTFNFLHFSIQEFLAAHHVTYLSPNDELKLLRKKFWSDIQSNMFVIYISLTKGERPSFKQFIKPSLEQRFKNFLTGAQVANQFFDNEIKCFRLFKCFYEAGDKEMCASIENAETLNFNSKLINLYNNQLSPSDVECITVFLTCSSHRSGRSLTCMAVISKIMVSTYYIVDYLMSLLRY